MDEYKNDGMPEAIGEAPEDDMQAETEAEAAATETETETETEPIYAQNESYAPPAPVVQPETEPVYAQNESCAQSATESAYARNESYTPPAPVVQPAPELVYAQNESYTPPAPTVQSATEPVYAQNESYAQSAPESVYAQNESYTPPAPTVQSATEPVYAQYAPAGQAKNERVYTQKEIYMQSAPAGQPASGYGHQSYTQGGPEHNAYGQPAPAYGYVGPEQPAGIYGQPQPQGGASSPYSQFAQAQYGQTPPAVPKQKKQKNGSGGSSARRLSTVALVVIVVCACVASGIFGGFVGAKASSGGGAVNAGNDNTPGITISPSDDVTTSEAVAKKVLSSVVGITSTGQYTTEGFFGWGSQEVSGVGTGMVIDNKGYILTNSHVVMDGTVDTITVLLSDGREVEGSVVWNDAGLDIAIVKVEADGLTPVEMGDSDAVAIGSYVAAIGNPLGLEFSGSMTQGIVSGLNRTIEVADEMTGEVITMQGLIQVDAAINSGNSGGPLLNGSGQVIGVNTAKASAEGMGFAIPISSVMPIVEKVIKEGKFERVYMGVSAADVSVIRETYPNVELFADEGACITDVNPGSPAEKAGLMVKDVITAIDGTAIAGSDALIKLLLSYGNGDKITVSYDRGGETMETEVTLLSQTELEQAQQEENPFRNPQRNNGER